METERQVKRTFRRWLLRYCCSLTGVSTTSLKKLASAVCEHAPHAAETVFLYALDLGRVDDLAKNTEFEDVCEGWEEMRSLSSEYSGRAEMFLRDRRNALPNRYRKVLDAYDSIEANAANDRRVIAMMAQKTREALEASGVTRYRLAKDLGINEGNLYAWLAGDAAKMSRQTARRAWLYARSLV